jgi:hypothetical protein
VPFVAECPHCREAKFRVPWKRQDERTTCPKCSRDFLLLPEGTPQPALAERPGGAVAVRTASPTLIADAIPTAEEPEPTGHDVPFVVSLVSLVLIGLAVGLAYLPWGRLVAMGVSSAGLLASGLALVSVEKRNRRFAWGGMAGHALLLAILLVWPTLIGVGNWLPPADPNEGRDEIVAVSRETGQPSSATVVDVQTSVWQQRDCRIDLTSIRIAPLDPNAKTPEQKKIRALKVTVQVTNVGAERALEIAPNPPPEREIKLTMNGVAIPRKAIELTKPTTVYPGKTLDVTIAFDVPQDLKKDMRLELPSGWLGHRDPAWLAIPASMISKTSPLPRGMP